MANVKVNRHYRLLDEVAKEIHYEDEERRCAMVRRANEGYRNNLKKRMMRHLFNIDDGMVIRLRK